MFLYMHVPCCCSVCVFTHSLGAFNICCVFSVWIEESSCSFSAFELSAIHVPTAGDESLHLPLLQHQAMLGAVNQHTSFTVPIESFHSALNLKDVSMCFCTCTYLAFVQCVYARTLLVHSISVCVFSIWRESSCSFAAFELSAIHVPTAGDESLHLPLLHHHVILGTVNQHTSFTVEYVCAAGTYRRVTAPPTVVVRTACMLTGAVSVHAAAETCSPAAVSRKRPRRVRARCRRRTQRERNDCADSR